jgi:hypothetical protein
MIVSDVIELLGMLLRTRLLPCRFAGLVVVAALALACRSKQRADPERPLYRKGPTTLHLAMGSTEPLLHAPTPAELSRFPIYGDAQPGNLTVPIDWTQGPRSRSWRLFLHAWHFMSGLLAGYEKTRDPQLLAVALRIAGDWVAQNGQPAKPSWYDMAVASRASILGYLIRQGSESGILKPAERKTLVSAALAHGTWLASADHYKKHHNHGLFSDTGLLMLCRQLDALPECRAWRKTARERFRETLRQTVAPSGVHLEHSTSYHFVTLELVERALAADPELGVQGTRDRMRDVAPWLVQPDGHLPQIGDTSDGTAPEWAAKAATALRGSRFFRDAGYFVVRSEQAQLLVTGAYHSRAHKHEDDLSFVLYEGRRVLVDPGFGGYNDNRSREGKFLTSARAHNLLVVDGKFVWRPPPGSSLIASGEAAGWYGVWGHSPATPDGVTQDRVWLYEPGSVLLIVDHIVSDDSRAHDETRYFHFASDIEVSPTARGVELRAAELQGALLDASQMPVAHEIISGRKRPMQGFVCPQSALVPSPVLELTTQARNALLLSVLTLGRQVRPATASVARTADGTLNLRVGKARLSVARRGETLDLNVTPGRD